MPGPSTLAIENDEDSVSSASSKEKEEIPQYHPDSRWEEEWSDPYLTLFDMNREPRKVILDNPNQRMRIQLKGLSNEFQCPVCLGYMKNTSIVMECLHRFCGECIQKCLRLGKKECPTCRIHIPSRRSLRSDPQFDRLILSMCGDLEALEEQQEREIEMINKAQHMNNTYTESRKRGIRAQASQRKKTTEKHTFDAVVEADVRKRAKKSPSIVGIEPSPLIDFFLRRHPQETRVDRLYRELLRVNHELPVATLKTFLSRKLAYAPSSHFQILSSADGETVVLDDKITMKEAKRDLNDVGGNDTFVLHYRIYVP